MNNQIVFFLVLRQGFFLRNLLVEFFFFSFFFVAIDIYPGEVQPYLVFDVNLVNLAKTASELSFQTFFFFEIWGVFGYNLNSLRQQLP